MALAQGFEVYKMFVGHRGANHPVKNHTTSHVELTTQNHGFAVDAGSIDAAVAEVTHRNLNDETVEGLRFRGFRCSTTRRLRQGRTTAITSSTNSSRWSKRCEGW